MKKSYWLFLIALVASISFTSCAKPYMKPHTEEIKTNETAFLVNLEASGQAKLDSIEYYEQAKVQAKRVTIAQRWEKTGRTEGDGRYIDTQKLIRVDRSPVTQL